MTRDTFDQVLIFLGVGGGAKILWDIVTFISSRRKRVLDENKNEFDTLKSALDSVRKMMTEDTSRIKEITDQLTRAMIEIGALKSLLAERDREIQSLKNELAEIKKTIGA